MAQEQAFIPYLNQTPDFAQGVEYGRIFSKMESGAKIVTYENGEPIHTANVEQIRQLCRMFNYIPQFSECVSPGGIIAPYLTHFQAIKNTSLSN